MGFVSKQLFIGIISVGVGFQIFLLLLNELTNIDIFQTIDNQKEEFQYNVVNNYQEWCSTLFYPRPLFGSLDKIINKTSNNKINSNEQTDFFNSIQLNITAQSIISMNSAQIIRIYCVPNLSCLGERECTRHLGVNAMKQILNKRYLCVFNDGNNTVILSKPVRELKQKYHFIIDCDISDDKHKLLRNQILSSTNVTNIGLYIFNSSNINYRINYQFVLNHNMLLPVCSTIITENVLSSYSYLSDTPTYTYIKYDDINTGTTKKPYKYAICSIMHAQYSTHFNDTTQTEYLLKQWIEYHLMQGFQRFYIYQHYDSTTVADDQFQVIINNINTIFNKTIIIYIPWHIGLLYYSDLRWYQLSQINDCLNRFKYETEYMLFIDLDEWILPKYHLFNNNSNINVIKILNSLTNNTNNKNTVSIPRYTGITDAIANNIDVDCDMSYYSFIERQTCIILSPYSSKEKLGKSIVKTNNVYVQRIHFPSDFIEGQKRESFKSNQLFILHTKDHKVITIIRENINLTTNGSMVMLTALNCTNTYSQDVVVAMHLFDKYRNFSDVGKNIYSIINTKNNIYCYYMFWYRVNYWLKVVVVMLFLVVLVLACCVVSMVLCDYRVECFDDMIESWCPD